MRARHNVRTMDRRLLLAALGCWPAGRLLAADDPPRPQHKVGAGTLYEALSSRFPVRMGPPGLMQLQVSAPRLLLLPARNKLGAELVVELGGAPLPRVPAGEMEVLFSLRYEPADRSLRAHEAEIVDFRWPGMPPEALRSLRGVLPAMARDFGEFVLHRFTPRDLAVPDTMGFDPSELRVVDDGVLVVFARKPAQ